MAHPSIAVIVPLLNERDRLPGLLQMLAGLHADEVVIVDGGSTDGTELLLAEAGLPWCRGRPGRAAQMNRGAEQCRSEILLFLHADTEITSIALQHLREVMSDPDRVVGGRFDVRLSGNAALFRIIEYFINLRSRLTKISTGDQGIFVRRDLFERVGGFPDQPLMEDIEFSKRLKREGRLACLRDKVTTSSRRWEKHGIIRTTMLMWKLRFLYWVGVTPERLARMYQYAR